MMAGCYGALKKLFTYNCGPYELVGSIKVEKYVKWVVKKLGSRNTKGRTNEAHFPTLIS